MSRERLPVVFQIRATLEVETIDVWWRTNRAAAPELFLLELERVLDAVARFPELGTPARSGRLEHVRRLLLPRTKHYVYYRRMADVIEVLAVWHAARGQVPEL